MFSPSIILLLAWGAFAFGAEYSWAYAPLLVWAATVGLLGWLASRGTRFPSRALAVALAAVFVAASLQLVPLPRRLVATLSPAALAVDYDALYAKATMREPRPGEAGIEAAGRPLSIAPSRTALGLAFLGAFAFLLVGSTRGIGRVGPHGIARAVIVLGALAALVGIVQKASGSDVVYGFWYQRQPQNVFAPFNNRNHFAGWAVMAFSMAGGYFAGSVARAFRGVKPDWRHRVLWFSTREASGTLLTAMALFVMATAVILTASRSGFLCLVLATALLIGRALRRQTTRSRRAVGASYLVLALVMGAIWGGIDTVLQRFASAYAEFELSGTGRTRVWQDTVRIIRDFPWTGPGLNTYGVAMLYYQTLPRGDYFIEAHNDYLQLAAEGGVLVGLPALVALGLFVCEVRRRFREGRDDTMTSWLRAGAVTGLVAIAVQELSDFTLQMPGAVALFIVLAAIAIHEADHATHRHAAASAVPDGQAVFSADLGAISLLRGARLPRPESRARVSRLPRYGWRRFVFLCVFLAGTGLAAIASGRDRWVAVETGSVTVVSNAGADAARAVAHLFENLHATFRPVWRLLVLPDTAIRRCPVGETDLFPVSPLRVLVLAVARERDLREIVPQFWQGRGARPGAVYWPGPHRHYIALRLDRPLRDWRRDGTHEYVHLVNRTTWPTLPAWLDEGLAELGEAATVDAGGVTIGWPVPEHLQALRSAARWMPLPELFGLTAPPAQPERLHPGRFYAEAWALVHYLLLGAPTDSEIAALERSPIVARHRFGSALGRYFDLRASGREAVDAARVAFGDPVELERTLRAYVRGRSFRVVRVDRSSLEILVPRRPGDAGVGSLGGPVASPLQSVRPLDEADALVVRARALVDGERPQAALPLLARARRLAPRHPGALEALGIFWFRHNQLSAAARAFDEAIATGRAGSLTLFYRALVAGADGDAGAPDAAKALERAVALDPTFAPAYARLASLYARDPERLAEALALARRATALEPHEASTWLALADLLVRAGRVQEAREAGHCALVAARSTGERQAAERLVKNIESR